MRFQAGRVELAPPHLVRTDISTADSLGAVPAPGRQRGDGLLGDETAGEKPWQLLTARGAPRILAAIGCGRPQPIEAAIAVALCADEVPVPALLHSARWSVQTHSALEVIRHRVVVFFTLDREKLVGTPDGRVVGIRASCLACHVLSRVTGAGRVGCCAVQ